MPQINLSEETIDLVLRALGTHKAIAESSVGSIEEDTSEIDSTIELFKELRNA